MKQIGVGVIGASPLNPGWAVTSHLPAIRALPDFELAAVATSNPASATAATSAYGVFGTADPDELIARPDVDLVVVAVKVTDHDRLLKAALDAGKMVLSEWPLGADIEQSSRLSEMAAQSGTRSFIGMQARFSPVVARVRQLLDEGYVGQVLGTTLVGSAETWGAETIASRAYVFDESRGATMLNITMSHVLDALNFLLGEFVAVTGALGVGRRTVRLTDEGNREIAVTSPDHAAIAGRLESGATASVFFRGGTSRGQNLHWEINGTEGDLVISGASGKLHISPLSLRGGRGSDTDLAPIEVISEPLPEGVQEFPGGNVYRLYEAIAADIRDGTQIVPDFAHALKRHRLLTAVQEASRNL
ncbi:Gfo/Idh/MocA family protein [Sphingobium phenoxybenzoativorans]|uniref:Gfo/Idh/MocA family protein n=1 Tax=Sphingobium phenoxybenzoativorans TaxID=1592790 RepID=UPI000871C3B7|nr:Gfo/Idh/MocA family oxidoreductase [Sphingobium phenoxybenzoativorans]